MLDQSYWDTVLQNIADMRIWLAEVEQKILAQRISGENHYAPAKRPTTTVDEDVAAADSPTRVQKALEREFGVDRRTIYQRVERLTFAYQMQRTVPDWRENVEYWKSMAVRDASGKTRLERGLLALEAKGVAA